MSTTNVVLDLLHDNPYQPRLVDDPAHIEKLARSIAADGLQQLPKAREVEVWYQLAFGHSRRKAFEWLVENYEAQGLPDRYDGYTCMPVEIEDLSDEAMFRLAVTENVQRKDLDPIEMAKSMKAYRDEFSRTSAEIGALYGMSDATVRGMIRLLDLPEPAQTALSQGEISQGTARALLAVQKIVPAQDMPEVLKRIKSKESDETPESVIEAYIRFTLHAHEMWADGRHDGKPRSAWHGGWLLDMKNFPNQHLPVIQGEQVFGLLGVKPSQRLQNCVKAAADADALARMWETSDFEQDHALGEKLAHLVNPPVCTACPFYVKINGSHYCGVKACHERKSAAWRANKIHMDSKELKIAIYQPSDGKYKILDHHDSGQKRLFTKRHADLRLLDKDVIKGYHWQSLDGVDDDVMRVVIVGQTLKNLAEAAKTLRVEAATEERASLTAEQMFTKMRSDIWDALAWEASATLKQAFSTIPDALVIALNEWNEFDVTDDIAEEHAPKKDAPEYADFLRRALVTELLEDFEFHRFVGCKSPAELLAYLTEKAQPFGLDLPERMAEVVAYYDQQLSVAAETPAKKAKK